MTEHATKPCRTCGRILSLGQFYRHPGTSDGRLSDCKACKRAYEAEQRQLKAESIRAYRRAYEQRPERIASRTARHAAWIKTDAGRESRRITQRAYRAMKRLTAGVAVVYKRTEGNKEGDA